jgi:UDP:flavonoid glycosyltransferase YjiC (YdhE family)
MRVVVTSLAERTHLLPTVPVAWALRAAGHDVILAVPPRLVTAASQTGLHVVQVGRDHRVYRTLERLDRLEGGEPGGRHRQASMGLSPAAIATMSWGEWTEFFRHNVGLWWRLMNDPMMGDLVRLCRSWRPHLVLWEGFTWAGAVAAAASGTAHARVLSGSDLLGAARERFLSVRAECGGRRCDPLAEWLGGRLASFGADLDESVVRGQATIDYLPPSLRLGTGPVTGAPATAGPVRPDRHAPPVLPVRFVPYNGRTRIPAWLRTPPARPRVCVTLGQSTFDHAHHADGHGSRGGIAGPRPAASAAHPGIDLRDLLTGIADLGLDVVATLPAHLHPTLRPLPPHVRLETFVPLDALAATCTAVVNHGGAGTICTTARHAVPQLVVPDDTYDERLLGEALAATGAGLVLDAAAATPGAVRAAVGGMVTGDRFRRDAGALREEVLAMPTPAALVPRLEDLAGRGSSGGEP